MDSIITYCKENFTTVIVLLIIVTIAIIVGYNKLYYGSWIITEKKYHKLKKEEEEKNTKKVTIDETKNQVIPPESHSPIAKSYETPKDSGFDDKPTRDSGYDKPTKDSDLESSVIYDEEELETVMPY